MKVGFIGLGLMGRGMAGNIRKAGHEMVIHDLRKDAAEPFLDNKVGWAATPRELAEQCDVVFTSLPKPNDVEAVLAGKNGLGAGFRKGAAWFDLSTNSVEVVRRLNAELKEKGVDFMDAPVSGGPSGAASGKLAIWVGGPKPVYDKYVPVLTAMADAHRYIGEIGAGSIAKLVHNMCSAGFTQVLAEAMSFGIKAGLEPLQLYEAIRGGAMGRMRSFDIIARRWLAGGIEPASFQLQLLHKDIRLAVELARGVGVPVRLCDLVYDELTEAMNRGWGERDAQMAQILQQERAGIPKLDVPIEAIEEVMKNT